MVQTLHGERYVLAFIHATRNICRLSGRPAAR